MSRGIVSDGDCLGGACAGVSEHGSVLCAVPSRYVYGRLTKCVASAGTPRREGGSHPCEVIYAASGGQRTYDAGESAGYSTGVASFVVPHVVGVAGPCCYR